MKFATDIHDPQRTIPNNFHNSLTFHLAFLLVNFFSSSQDASKLNEQIQPQLHFDFNAFMQICHESVPVEREEWWVRDRGVNVQHVSSDSKPLQLYGR